MSMLARSVLVIVAGMVMSAADAGEVRDDKAYELFECAILNESTSPNYVLITVTDGRSHETRQFVTTANLLVGAIHREYDLSWAKSMKIALAAHDRHFTFNKPAALANIPPRYDSEMLAKARNRLAKTPDLLTANLFKVCVELSGTGCSMSYIDALAHVLLEQGILCYVEDSSGQLFVDPGPCRQVRPK